MVIQFSSSQNQKRKHKFFFSSVVEYSYSQFSCFKPTFNSTVSRENGRSSTDPQLALSFHKGFRGANRKYSTSRRTGCIHYRFCAVYQISCYASFQVNQTLNQEICDYDNQRFCPNGRERGNSEVLGSSMFFSHLKREI